MLRGQQLKRAECKRQLPNTKQQVRGWRAAGYEGYWTDWTGPVLTCWAPGRRAGPSACAQPHSAEALQAGAKEAAVMQALVQQVRQAAPTRPSTAELCGRLQRVHRGPNCHTLG